jgi:hypothetical protein
MPLSALVAQATLTVVHSTNVTSEAKMVPTLDFNSPNFLADGLDDGIAPILSRISSATISIPAILPMDAVHPNSTYNLSFKGPGLNCRDATDNTTISAIDSGSQEDYCRSSEGAQTFVTTTIAVNSYYFEARSLVLSYTIAFVVSLFCVFVGLRAMFVNGVSHSMSFSTIVAVTRNSTLDHLLVGNSLGAEPMNMEVMAKKLFLVFKTRFAAG